jgi:hypothetical protein
MTAQQLSMCRSCGARVLWVRTMRGKRMPLDADHAPLGPYVIVKHVDGGDVAVMVTPSSVDIYAHIKQRYTSHFSTCPNAKDWRRRD